MKNKFQIGIVLIFKYSTMFHSIFTFGISKAVIKCHFYIYLSGGSHKGQQIITFIHTYYCISHERHTRVYVKSKTGYIPEKDNPSSFVPV